MSLSRLVPGARAPCCLRTVSRHFGAPTRGESLVLTFNLPASSASPGAVAAPYCAQTEIRSLQYVGYYLVRPGCRLALSIIGQNARGSANRYETLDSGVAIVGGPPGHRGKPPRLSGKSETATPTRSYARAAGGRGSGNPRRCSRTATPGRNPRRRTPPDIKDQRKKKKRIK